MSKQTMISSPPIHPSAPLRRAHQTPEAPVDIRDIKRYWNRDCFLYKAAKKLVGFHKTFISSKRDSKGMVALEYPDFLLVAKKYIWREKFVSIHETVIKYALRKNKKIVIYIEENDWFYELEPKRILQDDETKPNIRGRDSSQRMLNFNIRLGHRVFEPQTILQVVISKP